MSKIFRIGDRDIAVTEIRSRLIQIGFSLDSVDPEFFDEKLSDAVKAFQAARGLNVDGLVGPLTLQRLEEARWFLGDRPLSYQPGHMIRGEDVTSLQQRLSTMGFNPGKIDGIFGPLTETALKEFQTGAGIEADGLAASETFQALKRLVRTVSGGQAERLRQTLLLDSLRTGIAAKTIVLDPAHGGTDRGFEANGAVESEIATAVVSKLQGRLAALGATVVLTRPLQHPESPTEAERAVFANEVVADLVVSIHCDAATSEAAAGIATMHFGSTEGGWSHAGERAAQRIHNALLATTNAPDCRIHARTWDMLRLTRMPAVRVEVGYVSNPAEAELLISSDYQDKIAAGITAGITKFFAPSNS